jgi:hypothetical protein
MPPLLFNSPPAWRRENGGSKGNAVLPIFNSPPARRGENGREAPRGGVVKKATVFFKLP